LVLKGFCISLHWVLLNPDQGGISFFPSDSKLKNVTAFSRIIWINMKIFKQKPNICKNKLFCVISKPRSGFGSKQIRMDFCTSDPHTDKMYYPDPQWFPFLKLFVGYIYICMRHVRFSAVFRIREILVRIRILGSVHFISRSGSCLFRNDFQNTNKK
jgi:hypothetical protein